MTEFLETVGLCPARLMFEVTTIKKYMTDMYDVPSAAVAAATVSDSLKYNCSVFATVAPWELKVLVGPVAEEDKFNFRVSPLEKANAATNEAGTAAKIPKKRGKITQKSRHIELQRSSNAFDTSTEMWLAYLPDPASSFQRSC